MYVAIGDIMCKVVSFTIPGTPVAKIAIDKPDLDNILCIYEESNR